MGDALRAQDHLEIVSGERADAVLDDLDLVGLAAERLVELGRLRAGHELVRLPYGAEDRVLGLDLRIAGPEADSDVDDPHPPRAGGFQDAGRGLEDALGTRDESDDALLAIESEERGRFGIELRDVGHGRIIGHSGSH